MNLNHLTVSGNLTRDPEFRSVGADKSVTHFTIAHNNRYKTHDGEQKEEVSFIECEAWGRQGEVAAQYLVKGSLTIVEGRIKQDNWLDKDGQKRSKLKIVADRVHLVSRPGAKDERDDAAGEGGSGVPAASSASPTTDAGGSRPASRPASAPAPRPAPRAAAGKSGMTEDPPF